MQYQRLPKVSKGVSAKFMRQFFILVAIPKMLYVTDLFLIPGLGISKGTKGFISKLAKIQRQVTLHITGALRSTPMDTIDACADMLPFHLLVKSLMHRAVTRLATLPQPQPLVKHVAQAANRYVKTHQVPLHEVMHTFNVHPHNFGSIKPCTGGPTIMVCILDSKEEAKLMVVADRSEVSVFSDRSGHEGGIGMAAVLYRGGEEKCSLRKFLGSEERHMVFKADLLGLSLAAEMVKGKRQVWSLTIGIDSQAMMHATGHRRAILGQHLVEAFHKQVAAGHEAHAKTRHEGRPDR